MPRERMALDDDRLRGLHASGLTVNQIAAAMGISHGTAMRHLRRLRIRARPRGQQAIRRLKLVGGMEEVRGLAAWLRAAAGARSRVDLAPSTAVMIAGLLEASVGVEQRSAT